MNNDSHEVVTDVITTKPSTYARAALMRLASRWWWIAVLPSVFLIIATVNDIAFIYATLIWICMILPPGVMFAYYNYLLRPSAAALSLPHRVIIYPDYSIRILFVEAIEDEEPNDTPNDSAINHRPALHEDIMLSPDQLTRCSDNGRTLQLDFHDAPIDILLIPLDTIPASSLTQLTQLGLVS